MALNSFGRACGVFIALLDSEKVEAQHGINILEIINMMALARIAMPRTRVAEACEPRTYPHVLPRHFSFNLFLL
jgi:biotin synthase-like enzyme